MASQIPVEPSGRRVPQVCSGERTITNYQVVLPTVNAADTPSGMGARVSLGSGTAGEFRGVAQFYPAFPRSPVTLHADKDPDKRFLEYGDAQPEILGGQPRTVVQSATTGRNGVGVPIRVFGVNPTLPSRKRADGSSFTPDGVTNSNTLPMDYLARWTGALFFQAQMSVPWSATPLTGAVSNHFSVATIPTAVKVTNITPANPQYDTAEQSYFFGAYTSTSTVYDGIDGPNFNYVGEWLQTKTADGSLASDSGGGGTSNDTLFHVGPPADLNGYSGKTYSGDDAGRDAARQVLSKSAKDTVASGTEKKYQLYDYINLAMDSIGTSFSSASDGEIVGVPFGLRHVVPQSYFELTYSNYYTATDVGTYSSLRQYYLKIERATPSVDSSWASLGISPGLIDPNVSPAVHFQYYEDVVQR